jgi:hypothetical protein
MKVIQKIKSRRGKNIPPFVWILMKNILSLYQKMAHLLKYKLCSDHDIKIYYFTEIDSEYFDKIYCDVNILIKDIYKFKQK